MLRYGAETSFSRVTDTKGLRDSIPRSYFNIMDDMNDWGHANINLRMPMQMPGGAPAGYFKDFLDKKDAQRAKKAKRRRESKEHRIFARNAAVEEEQDEEC